MHFLCRHNLKCRQFLKVFQQLTIKIISKTNALFTSSLNWHGMQSAQIISFSMPLIMFIFVHLLKLNHLTCLCNDWKLWLNSTNFHLAQYMYWRIGRETRSAQIRMNKSQACYIRILWFSCYKSGLWLTSLQTVCSSLEVLICRPLTKESNSNKIF